MEKEVIGAEARYLTEKEVAALSEAMTPRAWLPCAVALETGLRIGDVVALPRASLDGSALTFTASKTGKQGKAELSPELAAEIRRGASKKWLFPSPYKRGCHITRQAVWSRIKRAAERSRVDARGASPHSLRKSYAVRLCRTSGMDAVKEALQHERNDTTELYALSDWTTGENASKPLERRDIDRIVAKVLEVLGRA